MENTPTDMRNVIINTIKKILLFLSAVVLGIWLFGPQEPAKLEASFDAKKLGENLNNYLSMREKKFDDLIVGVEKRIIWADKIGKKTPLSLIYIHGFSATSEEIRPVPDEIANILEANLYFTRLTGHGRGPMAMAEPTPISSPIARPTFGHLSPAVGPSDAHSLGTSQPRPSHPPHRDSSSSHPQPALRHYHHYLHPLQQTMEPEAIKDMLEAFCKDAEALESFYRDMLERGERVPGTPMTVSTVLSVPALDPVPESSIPSLGLPPGVLAAHHQEHLLGPDGNGSAGGGLPASMRNSIGSPMSILRRGSVQYDGMGLGSKNTK